MKALRRRLASSALALTILQAALLFAMPISACCDRAAAGHRTLHCCPAGSHPPGECPLHRSSQRSSGVSTPHDGETQCRMSCDMLHGPQLFIGTLGVLTPPAQTTVQFGSARVVAAAELLPTLRPSIPDPPPPKLL